MLALPISDQKNVSGKASPKRTSTIQSVSIAAKFLKILAASGDEMALSDLARRAEVSRSTAHRYMQTLVKEDLVTQNLQSGFYALGPATLSIGVAALKGVDAVETAAIHMKELARTTAISTGVAIWTERGPTIVRWFRSAYFAINPLSLGDVLPIDNTACGLVFQSFLPSAEINIARNNQPAHFHGDLPEPDVLRQIHEAEWAEKTSHLFSGVTGQAAPVFNAQGELACVMTTVTDLGRLKFPEDRVALRKSAEIVNAKTSGKSSAIRQ